MNDDERLTILSDVERFATEELERHAQSMSDSSRESVSGELDAVADSVIRAALRKHHASLWPYSTPQDEQLAFGGVLFRIATGRPAWTPWLIEVAYVPEAAGRRVESEFANDLPLSSQGRVDTLRLYPPRVDIMFEFHQYVVQEIVGCVIKRAARIEEQTTRSHLARDFGGSLSGMPEQGPNVPVPQDVDELTDEDPAWSRPQGDPAGEEGGLLLTEAFSGNLSRAIHACEACGTSSPIAEHRLYRSCGVVLRCPNCDAIAAVLTERPDDHVVRLDGTWTVPD